MKMYNATVEMLSDADALAAAQFKVQLGVAVGCPTFAVNRHARS
jgi:hypothetical protein